MARMQSVTKTLKKAGTSEPPLVWNLKCWPSCLDDVKYLNEEQYWHVAQQLMDIARCEEPIKCQTQNINKIGDFWKLHEKGGPLGKTNLRIFFITEDSGDQKDIVVLGVHKKEQEGKLRNSVIIRIKRRMRLYKKSLSKKGTIDGINPSK